MEKNLFFFMGWGKYQFRIPKLLRMSGTCDTTSFSVQLIKDNGPETMRSEWELGFYWRPDVTWHYYWPKSYRDYKTYLYNKKYKKVT